MKRILPSLLLLLSLTAAAPAAQPQAPTATRVTYAADTVYVCMSKGSVAYHSSSDCAGLNRCSHEVKSMSTVKAEELGKRACKKCY